jgi:hypothetical protein
MPVQANLAFFDQAERWPGRVLPDRFRLADIPYFGTAIIDSMASCRLARKTSLGIQTTLVLG